MKAHLIQCHRTFSEGCARAAALRSIYEYLKANAPKALNCDDILRSAVILSVSSFDLLVHDIYRTEVLHRLSLNQPVNFLRVSYNTVVATGYTQSALIEQSIRTENSYKSFVAPDKIAEILRHLVEDCWEKIAAHAGTTAKDCKATLKRVVDLRNRIAHEADVNPALGGIELWPIYSDDVGEAIDFLRNLGSSITDVIDAT
ncbi:HEPN domain-containing protein [Sphingomonas sp. CFBP 13720]|uniref:HEPN domain-containing protein n=1 Tax=Sphingomonas sp. CFBP 13720 TaxID=2775302 RepID=UPI00177C22D2|nr:hypothetical protein [Sphingomonas sp. CFBP 13720]